MKNTTLQLEQLVCPSCVQKIEGALKRLKGVSEAKVLFNSSKAKVSYDEGILSPQDISEAVEKVGFEVLSQK